MAEYTKREWEVKLVDATLPKHHIVYAKIEPSIGYVGWDGMGVYDNPGNGKRELKTLNKEALANARLIASAPNLYEACKEALEITHDPKVEKILMEAIAKVEEVK